MSSNKEKRKIKKVMKISIVVLLLVVCGFGGFLVFNSTTSTSNKKESSVSKKNVVEAAREAVDYEAKVFMVGDALIHSSVYDDAKTADGSYDFRKMLQYIKPISSKYDISYYNQETILGGAELGYSNYPRFNTPKECGDAFIDAGFNTVSLATNHTMDKGEVGVLNSVNYWKSQNGVAFSGQWSSFEDRAESIKKVYEFNNIKYAFISYTIWTNGLETPYGKEYLNSLYSPEKAKADIESVRDSVDFVIVAMHWGTEYSFRIDYKQEEIANYLSSLGVDLIIGAHPHVIQPVSYINEGKTFVVYSLGNFISAQDDVDNYTGLAMEVTLRKHVDLDGTVTKAVVDPRAELVFTVTKKYKGWPSDFVVKPYPMLDESELRNHAGLYEQYKAVVKERYPDLPWGLTWE